MTAGSPGADTGRIPFISLVPFLLIAFGLAWGILGLFIFLPEQMTGMFGQLTGQHPLFFLAVYAPAIAAFIIIGHKAGARGLRGYLSRLLRWRCPGAQSAWSFTPFFAGSVAVSVIVTALFNSSRGSILLSAPLHFQLNNPIWPDAQPYDTFAFVAAAVLVVWIKRKTMFNREGGFTEVIPEALD